MKLTIGHIYPDLLNLYGDGGNIRCLQKRLEWRGIETELRYFLSGDKIDFASLDIVLLGGGSDREQALACDYLRKETQGLKDYVENGGVLLAVCGGYQLLGNYYKTSRTLIEGLGILDICTEWAQERLSGNIVLKTPLFKNSIVGFENHGGRTFIGKYSPFGKVVRGCGNDETSGLEGIHYKNVIGTYLHGPLLPKNPEVCDFMLTQAMKRKYGKTVRLSPLSDKLEYEANCYIVRLGTPFRRNNRHYALRASLL